MLGLPGEEVQARDALLRGITDVGRGHTQARKGKGEEGQQENKNKQHIARYLGEGLLPSISSVPWSWLPDSLLPGSLQEPYLSPTPTRDFLGIPSLAPSPCQLF